MSRGKAYTREMRAKHIKRKKNIVLHVYALFNDKDVNGGNGWYKHDGQYSKGKIHCSCPLCSIKAYYGEHIPTMQEQKQLEAMELELKELDMADSFDYYLETSAGE